MAETKKTTKKSTSKKKTDEVKEELILNPTSKYVIEAMPDSKHMKAGQQYVVTGEMAILLINKGTATLVK